MQVQNVKGVQVFGGLTAVIALLAGLGTAHAQAVVTAAPGAGSFPQSFLIPGTNTSLSLYGTVRLRVIDDVGSFHQSDTGPSNTSGDTPGIIAQLPLEGPGAATGTASSNSQMHALHGGLRMQLKSTQVFFETRTPTDLGEVKTVVMLDFGFLNNQNTYSGVPPSATAPGSGLGNNELARLQFAYGTLGPWLFGQYNSAWADPLQINPDIGDQSQVGPMQTANIRRPQIRYTYLAGNGLSVSGSVEANTYGNQFNTAATTIAGSANSIDSTDQGGYTNWPSANAGVAFDQPWGHVMGRVGVAADEIRQGFFGQSASSFVAGAQGSPVNARKLGWAVEGGVMINTFGKDQWRGLINYNDGASTYLSDMYGSGFYNTTTHSLSLVKELALNTSYIHRFNNNWRATAEFGIGFFNKPSGAAGFTAGPTTTANAPLANLEKRHLESGLSATYSPVPGMMDITLEWDHYNRWVQAAGTTSQANVYGATFSIFW